MAKSSPLNRDMEPDRAIGVTSDDINPTAPMGGESVHARWGS